MTDSTAVTLLEKAREEQHALSTLTLVRDPEAFSRLMQLAELMASGKSTLPAHLRGNKGDCAAIIQQASRWGMDHNAVAQKTHLVNGVLGYEAQLVIAVLNNSPLIAKRIDWQWFGDWSKIVGRFKTIQSKQTDDSGKPKTYRVPAWEDSDEAGLGVRASATLRGEEHPRVLELFMTQARTRNSTLWADDPKQQLAYLAAKRWGRLHAPDVMLGVYTPDELEMSDQPRNMGMAEVVKQVLTEDEYETWLSEARKGTAKAKDFWEQAGKPFRERASAEQRQAIWKVALEADAARTVDNDAAVKPEAAQPEVAKPEAPAADPAKAEAQGETDEFVRAMEEAERKNPAADNAYQRAKDGM